MWPAAECRGPAAEEGPPGLELWCLAESTGVLAPGPLGLSGLASSLPPGAPFSLALLGSHSQTSSPENT